MFVFIILTQFRIGYLIFIKLIFPNLFYTNLKFLRKQKKSKLEKVQKQDLNTYLGKDNSELVHLQNKVSNLQELQQDDIINYVQLDNNTLSTLTTILTKIIQKQRVVA